MHFKVSKEELMKILEGHKVGYEGNSFGITNILGLPQFITLEGEPVESTEGECCATYQKI